MERKKSQTRNSVYNLFILTSKRIYIEKSKSFRVGRSRDARDLRYGVHAAPPRPPCPRGRAHATRTYSRITALFYVLATLLHEHIPCTLLSCNYKPQVVLCWFFRSRRRASTVMHLSTHLLSSRRPPRCLTRCPSSSSARRRAWPSDWAPPG